MGGWALPALRCLCITRASPYTPMAEGRRTDGAGTLRLAGSAALQATSAMRDGGVNDPNDPFENFLDLVEAARILSIHPQSLRRLIKLGKVPAKLFAGKYLIERDKLEMFKSNYDPRPGRKPIGRLMFDER